MAQKVVYKGRSDARVLAAADLAKAGVEGFTKTVFQRNTPVEVEDGVAKALTENTKLFGTFVIEEPKAAETRDEPAKKSSK